MITKSNKIKCSKIKTSARYGTPSFFLYFHPMFSYFNTLLRSSWRRTSIIIRLIGFPFLLFHVAMHLFFVLSSTQISCEWASAMAAFEFTTSMNHQMRTPWTSVSRCEIAVRFIAFQILQQKVFISDSLRITFKFQN